MMCHISQSWVLFTNLFYLFIVLPLFLYISKTPPTDVSSPQIRWTRKTLRSRWPPSRGWPSTQLHHHLYRSLWREVGGHDDVCDADNPRVQKGSVEADQFTVDEAETFLRRQRGQFLRMGGVEIPESHDALVEGQGWRWVHDGEKVLTNFATRR